MQITARTFLIIWLGLIALLGGRYAYDFWLGSELPPGLMRADGRVDGDPISLQADMPGKIASLSVKEGDLVETGQTVGTLDISSIQTALEQAQQDYDKLMAERERIVSRRGITQQKAAAAVESAKISMFKALSKLERLDAVKPSAKARAQRQADEAEIARLAGQVKLAELAQVKIKGEDDGLNELEGRIADAGHGLAKLRESMGDPAIKAPADGVVTRRLLNVGDNAAHGQAVAEMADLSRVFLKLRLPKEQVAQLAIGLPAHVWLERSPDTTLTAKVGYIAEAPEPGPAGGPALYTVRLYFDGNPGKLAMPGQTGAALIRHDERVAWRKLRNPFGG